MKDIITIGMVNCASPESKMMEQRVSEYIRAVAARGAQFIVFPALSGVRVQAVQEAAVKHKVAAAFGLSSQKAVLCLPDGQTATAADGWETVDTAWGPVDRIMGLNCFKAYSRQSEAGINGFDVVIETFDLSEKNQEGAHE